MVEIPAGGNSWELDMAEEWHNSCKVSFRL